MTDNEILENAPSDAPADALCVDTEEAVAEDPAQQNQTTNADGVKIAVLNEEIAMLKEELEAYKLAKERQEKISEQLNEFSSLFPEIAVKSIPDEVWDTVRRGNSLSASYALYEKRITEAAKRIEDINSKNAASSAGIAGLGVPSEYFSPDEVRKMSQSEVRANYAKIKRSMEKWN